MNAMLRIGSFARLLPASASFAQTRLLCKPARRRRSARCRQAPRRAFHRHASSGQWNHLLRRVRHMVRRSHHRATHPRHDVLRQKLIDKFVPLMPGGAEASRIPIRHHVDDSIFGIVPLEIGIQTKDPKYLAYGVSWADRQWQNPQSDQGPEVPQLWRLLGRPPMGEPPARRPLRRNTLLDRRHVYVDHPAASGLPRHRRA